VSRTTIPLKLVKNLAQISFPSLRLLFSDSLLAFQGLDDRLAHWLLQQASATSEIKVTHQLIAEELASSREVISRLLKEFEQQNLIQLGRGSIRVINKLGLEMGK